MQARAQNQHQKAVNAGIRADAIHAQQHHHGHHHHPHHGHSTVVVGELSMFSQIQSYMYSNLYFYVYFVFLVCNGTTS